MFGLRSAQGRAILAGVVLVVLLVSIAVLALWRTRAHHQQHEALEHTSAVATALEGAQAQFRREQVAVLSTLLFSGDPGPLDDYHDAAVRVEQALSEARAEALARGEADELLALDNLTERIGQFNEKVDLALPVLLEADPETALQLATATRSEMWPESEAIVADLGELAREEQEELTARRAAADRAAGTTLWLLIGLSAAGFTVAAGTVAMLMVSVVRPLAALRANARTIASGDLKARAEVSGPEEVSSLARDFNEMTDALAAKTQEHIDTTNLTGDIIARLDKHGNWAVVNDAACQFYGKPREELLGTDSRAFAHPDDLKSTAQRIRKTSAGKELHKGFVNRQITPMGIRIVEWNGYPLFDEEGQYAGIQITGRDITERKRAQEALRSSEERLKILFEFAPDAYYLNDFEGNLVDGNKAAEELIGYKREELIGKTFLELNLLPPEELQKAAATLAKNVQGLPTGPDELTLNRKDGNQVPVEIRTFPVKIGEQTLVLGIARDITERKKMAEQREKALHDMGERMKELACIYRVTDLARADKSIEELLQDAVIAIPPGWHYPEITRAKLSFDGQECVSQPFEETPWKQSSDIGIGGEKRGVVEVYYLEERPELDEGPFVQEERNLIDGLARVLSEAAERKSAEEERERLHAELEVRAITDSLTGLYNHAHFFQRLAEEIDRSKRYNHGFAVLMLDVDDFKRFNDSRGHQAGDEMLRLVADCIQSGLRRSDLAFRYGGDEFATILPHGDSAKARAAVDRINRRITKRLKQMDGGAGVRLSLSAGVACFADDGITADDLVRIADAALYSAKWVARAHDIMGQREDIQSLVSALVSQRSGVEGLAGGTIFRPEALHEQQARIVSSVASSIAVALKDAGVAQALEDPDLQVLATVGAAAEIKDRHIRGHPERTSQRAAALAEEMGLSPEQVKDIRIASLLHDIGKVTVSEGILNKPGKLTRREFASIRDHPIVGATLVSQVKGFGRLVPIVRHHHERFDGKGYPDGLAGEDIPLEARILSVVDVFDAMTHQRSYRKALSRAEAIAELERGAGTQFDAAVVKAFLALVKRRGEELVAPAQAASGSAIRPQPNQPSVSPTPSG